MSESTVHLDQVAPVVPVASLEGRERRPTRVTAGTYVETLLQSLTGRARVASSDEAELHLERTDPGCWLARFPATLPLEQILLALSQLATRSGAKFSLRDDGNPTLRWIYQSSGITSVFGGSPRGLELNLVLGAPGMAAGTVIASSKPFGRLSAAELTTADETLPDMLRRVRAELRSAKDRREGLRFQSQRPVVLFPVEIAGTVHPPIWGESLDVSSGGLRVRVPDQSPRRYLYVQFADVDKVRDYGVLVRLVRQVATDDGIELSGQFVFAFSGAK